MFSDLPLHMTVLPIQRYKIISAAGFITILILIDHTGLGFKLA